MAGTPSGNAPTSRLRRRALEYVSGPRPRRARSASRNVLVHLSDARPDEPSSSLVRTSSAPRAPGVAFDGRGDRGAGLGRRRERRVQPRDLRVEERAHRIAFAESVGRRCLRCTARPDAAGRAASRWRTGRDVVVGQVPDRVRQDDRPESLGARTAAPTAAQPPIDWRRTRRARCRDGRAARITSVPSARARPARHVGDWPKPR